MKCEGLCLDKKPQEYYKLFFGDYGNLQRSDIMNHEIFRKLAEASEANTWFMNEIDYSKDKKGYELLPDNAKRMFHLNILHQNNMDSLVPNTFSKLSDIATDSWLTYLYSRISTEENIHALTYSSGLTKVFGAKGSEMIDYVYEDDMLKERMVIEIDTARYLIKKLKEEDPEVEEISDELKIAILDQLIVTYFLEGVKFPFSFFTTWSINKAYGNAIQGFSQALKLIAWDELTVHVPTGLNVMKTLMKNEEQGFSHLKTWFYQRVKEVAEITATGEMDWNRYLQKDGGIPGFTIDIGDHFIKYMVDYRMKSLIDEVMFDEKKSDIIDWFNEYRNLNKTQVALQEADSTNYQKGTLKDDLDSIDVDEFIKEFEINLEEI